MICSIICDLTSDILYLLLATNLKPKILLRCFTLNKSLNISLSDDKLWMPILYNINNKYIHNKYNSEHVNINSNIPYFTQFIDSFILNNFLLKYTNNTLNNTFDKKTLCLDIKQLKILPDGISQLTNLTSLDLLENKIKNMPSGLSQLTNLRTLNLSCNKIIIIPAEIEQLTNLQKLLLNNNQIEEITLQLKQLTNLEKFSLAFNKIKNLPNNHNLSYYTNLRRLYFYSNEITIIPLEITQLTKLQLLDLSCNQIEIIPSEIEQLTNLQILGIYNNLIEASSIEKLGLLTDLMIV